ncbi:MAG TPA: chorismate synthase [Methanocorpusculum sp.]|nr:chorismate synthase [Methanocorpusculum sp.]
MNTIGSSLKLTLFGASHDPFIGCIIDGIPAGYLIDEDKIYEDLALRKPAPGIGTARTEDDIPAISGLFNGVTTGKPLTITFANTNINDKDYDTIQRVPRPGHADYPAFCKYGASRDVRGGGMFSGRMTAPLVACGAILRDFCGAFGISVGSYVSRIGNVVDTGEYLPDEIMRVSRTNALRAMSQHLEMQMKAEILAAKSDGDSVGGIVRCVSAGLPPGLGEPFFDTLDGEIAKAVFAIPGIKGISFGAGFASAKMRGSENNDSYRMENGSVETESNNAGGVLGGMANGAALDFSVVFKPTPSIAKPQKSVDLVDYSDAQLFVKGRHDPCIAPRGAIVVEAMTLFVLSDLLIRGGYAACQK